MRVLLASLLIAGALLAVASAKAGPDKPFLGTGRSGALTVSKRDTVVNRYARVESPLLVGDESLWVDSVEGFAEGSLVMVLQTTGLVPAAVPGSRAPVDLSHGPVGRWELVRLRAVGENVLHLSEPLRHSYAAEVTQVILVPEFTRVHIQPGASIVARPWNGATGGVVALLVAGTLINEGAIDVSGMGFRGGARASASTAQACNTLGAPGNGAAHRGEGVDGTEHGRASGRDNVANGGGGGTCLRSGGGGGGNFGYGSEGGQGAEEPRERASLGGVRLIYSLLEHMTFGGGGGGGAGAEGGSGGGAIFLAAGELTGRGSLLARGAPGGSSEAGEPGGGGAGGSLLLQVAGSMKCSVVDAAGGAGGVAAKGEGTGGVGGGGRVAFQASGTPDCLFQVQREGAGNDESKLSGSVVRIEGDASPGDIVAPDNTPPELRVTTVGGRTYSAGIIINDSRPRFEGQGCACPPNSAIAQVTVTINPSVDGGVQVGEASCRDGVNWNITPGRDLLGNANRRVREFPFEARRACESNNIVNDGISNINAIFAGTFVIDQDPPTTRISNPPQSPMPLGEVRIGLVGADETPGRLQGFECSLDGGTFGTCQLRNGCRASEFCYLPELAEGMTENYALVVRARDEAGNVDPTPAAYTWTVDNDKPAPPVITLPALDGRYVNTRTPVIKGSSSEDGGVVTVSVIDPVSPGLEYSAMVDGTRNWRVVPEPGLDDGSYEISARVRDSARNLSGESNRVRFLVDTLPPETAIDNQSELPSITNEASLQLRLSSPGGESGSGLQRFDCSVDGSPPQPCPAPDASGARTLSVTTDGQHLLYVHAVDKANNVDPTPAVWRWWLDRVAPETSIVRGPSGRTTERMAIFQFSSDEQGVSYECQHEVDGNVSFAYTECSNPRILEGLPQGNHTLRVRAKDGARNTDLSPAVRDWIVDLGLPQARITSPESTGPLLIRNVTVLRFTFENASSTLVARFECRVGASSSFVECTSPHEVSRGDGEHVFQVRAVSSTEVVTPENMYASFRWVVDTIVPETSITAGPAEGAWIPANTVSLSVTANERELRGFQCNLNGRGFEECPTQPNGGDSIQFTYSSLADGTYTFQVTAIDKAGNQDPTPAQRSWTVDTQAPAVPDFRAPGGEVRVSTSRPTLEGNAEPDTRLILLLGEQREPAAVTMVNADGSWRAQIDQSLASEAYDVKAYVIDRAGNESGIAQVRLIVDDRFPSVIKGGGMSCSSLSTGWTLLALVGWFGLMRSPARRRRC